MGIYLRGNIWFCDFTDHSGKRIRKSLHTESKIEAQELFDRLKSDSWRVRHLKEKEKHTFEDACERWIKEKRTKRTIKGDISKLKRLSIKFGKRLLADIGAGELTAFVYSQSNEKHRQNWEAKQLSNKGNNLPIGKYRPKPVKIATSISYIRLLKALFRAAAFEWGWLENPLYFKVPQPDSSRTRWLRKNEVQRLLSELPEYLKDVVRFALATGLRRSNIINLKWSQVDIERNVAWIDADEMKGKKPIGVVFNRTAENIVRK